MKHLRVLTLSIVIMFALVAFMSPATAVFAEEPDEEENYFCTEDADGEHPVAAGIAELYEIEYDDVMALFCEPVEGREDPDDSGWGLGQIMLALETGDLEGTLAKRAEGMGWGEIWQEMGLIGNKKEGAGPPWWADNDYDGEGPPPWAGKKDK